MFYVGKFSEISECETRAGLKTQSKSEKSDHELKLNKIIEADTGDFDRWLEANGR